MDLTISKGAGDSEDILYALQTPITYMESVIRKLHEQLQKYPDASVIMSKVSSRGLMGGNIEGELLENLKNNLPAALEAFKPIHIHVGKE